MFAQNCLNFVKNMPIYFARFFRPAYYHSANRMQSEVTNFMDTIYERTIFTK